mmetsp:Transcript_5267/g.15951  ORF Transcript_5267/g.15951 Transcript_5267/m.15951 type:complete len:318 (+) Transcript_5267:2664-3617(+)|eukprot:364579-Chlamydomonas_euryale.AAC.10
MRLGKDVDHGVIDTHMGCTKCTASMGKLPGRGGAQHAFAPASMVATNPASCNRVQRRRRRTGRGKATRIQHVPTELHTLPAGHDHAARMCTPHAHVYFCTVYHTHKVGTMQLRSQAPRQAVIRLQQRCTCACVCSCGREGKTFRPFWVRACSRSSAERMHVPTRSQEGSNERTCKHSAEMRGTPGTPHALAIAADGSAPLPCPPGIPHTPTVAVAMSAALLPPPPELAKTEPTACAGGVRCDANIVVHLASSSASKNGASCSSADAASAHTPQRAPRAALSQQPHSASAPSVPSTAAAAPPPPLHMPRISALAASTA